MRKQYLRILIALIGAAGLAKAAKGQSVDQIVVNIPYEIVVAGKTLPAGTYRVNRVPNPIGRLLVFSSLENRTSAIVLATDVENETADHVFNIPVSRSAIMEPQRDHTAAPLPQEVRIEATRSLIYSGAACGRSIVPGQRWVREKIHDFRAMAVMQATAATTPNSSPGRK